ncbi:hypothetical protein WJX72_005654 [[Myrmecia] bisecta]|uniref:Mitochondrial carrier protein n=1 Tax=[Myrmecia] bisecta TaxID=41462 RepID=A0AAW1QQP5_9CHLO
MKKRSTKVYFSLLAICYLEVLLWTTCLVSSCATCAARAEDTGYLLRETGNLKQTIGTWDNLNRENLPGSVDLRGADLHRIVEEAAFQRLRDCAAVAPAATDQRPHLCLNFLPLFNGPPAAYTGIKAGVYPNVFMAASAITSAAGPRGLFTGYLPTLLEDVPDMAFKFAAYESLRSVHRNMVNRQANAQEDFAMGAISGAFAAAATTPLDVIKTQMMCSAASRPTMMSAARKIMGEGGATYFFRGVGPRALSNGINSAVFFCFFEALRASFARHKQATAVRKAALAAQAEEQASHMRPLVRSLRREQRAYMTDLQPAPASLALSFQPLKIGARVPRGSMRKA